MDTSEEVGQFRLNALDHKVAIGLHGLQTQQAELKAQLDAMQATTSARLSELRGSLHGLQEFVTRRMDGLQVEMSAKFSKLQQIEGQDCQSASTVDVTNADQKKEASAPMSGTGVPVRSRADFCGSYVVSSPQAAAEHHHAQRLEDAEQSIVDAVPVAMGESHIEVVSVQPPWAHDLENVDAKLEAMQGQLDELKAGLQSSRPVPRDHVQRPENAERSIVDLSATLSDRNASKCADEANEPGYALQQSVWDVSIFVGVAGNPDMLCSAWTVALIAANTLVQAILTYVVLYIYSDSEITEKKAEQYRLWRVNVGQSLKTVQSSTGLSHAARVCLGDAGLEMSNGQSAAFEDIREYSADFFEAWQGIAKGPVICLCCLFVWFMSVLGEVAAAIQLMLAAIQLRGRATELIATGESKRIKTLSHARVAWFIAVQAVRLAIALGLGYAGIRFDIHM